MQRIIKKIILGALVLGWFFPVYAQQIQTPADANAAIAMDAMAQSAGDFDQVDLSYIHTLGMQQKAWNNPMEHLGEGQTKPGYSRYNWMPDTVLPLRLREGMMTLINLPTWELIEKVHIGSPESFGGEIVAPNSLLLYADPNYIGVDSNMIIFGRSGNRYVFYLRSETFNTDKITQSVVDVLVGPRWTPVSAGGQMGDNNGASSMAASPLSGGVGKANATSNTTGAFNVAGEPQDWLKTVPMDPESIRFDLDMFLPNPEDVDIAPDNIWRDNIFTYIDLGPKALTMTQRPVVSLLQQDVEVPVGYRTRGPNSRLIVVEAIGDLVLRNGRKLICIKLRRDPARGLEYTDYSGSNAMLPVSGTVSHQAVPNQALVLNEGAVLSQTPPVVMTDVSHASYAVQPYCNDATGANRCVGSGFSNIKSIPDDIMQANRDVLDSVGKNAIVPIVGTENIAVEFGTSTQISELESLWNTIYNENKDLLSGYEPYYSVDATADGEVVELFRLRAGMLKDVSVADALCRKLGRKGYSCSVVRIQ